MIRMHAAMMHASRAMRMRASGPSFGVIARKAGTVAIGSMITKSDAPDNSMYLSRSIRRGGFDTRRENGVFHAVNNFFIGRNSRRENAAEIRALLGAGAIHEIVRTKPDAASHGHSRVRGEIKPLDGNRFRFLKTLQHVRIGLRAINRGIHSAGPFVSGQIAADVNAARAPGLRREAGNFQDERAVALRK